MELPLADVELIAILVLAKSQNISPTLSVLTKTINSKISMQDLIPWKEEVLPLDAFPLTLDRMDLLEILSTIDVMLQFAL